jgi:hypothetical protein
MSKEKAKEYSDYVKKTGETLKRELVYRGLDKDKDLVKRVETITKECTETSEYIEKRIEK